MNPENTERRILEGALRALKAETGIEIDVVAEGLRDGNRMIDAVLKIPGFEGTLTAEVKRWAAHINPGALTAQLEGMPQPAILVADYVNPNMGERLKAAGIQYIDMAGNAYINQPPVFVYLKGNKRVTEGALRTQERNRAFEATGLKMVYHLLREPEMIDAPYREIADRADVAVGTVGWVLNGLKDAGYARGGGKGRARKLINRRKLLDRWVEAYPEKLKPKLALGTFVGPNPEWWAQVDAEKYGVLWGGEVAAARYTQYLKPKDCTIYLPDNIEMGRLLQATRLRKAEEVEVGRTAVVNIYRVFWPVDTDRTAGYPDLVHPLLVYADLVATGDTRNIETAKKLYGQHIAEYLEQD